jgi:hypothetical protein
MKFIPRTEEEVKKFKLLQKGDADYEILDAQEEISKTDKEMLHLKLKVFDATGAQSLVHDYIMLNDENFEYKLRHLFYSCGLGELYETGDVEPFRLLGKCGKLDLGIQADKTGQYSDKNNVKDYLTDEKLKTHQKKNQSATAETVTDDFQDDDVPF